MEPVVTRGRPDRDPGGGGPVDRRARLGRLGERVAARFLQERGARILARNVTVAGGEIDILAEIDGRRAVVEVRTVTGELTAAEAFGVEKAHRVWRLAARLQPPVSRVDLVGVRLHAGGIDVHWVRSVS